MLLEDPEEDKVIGLHVACAASSLLVLSTAILCRFGCEAMAESLSLDYKFPKASETAAGASGLVLHI
jgi:hypothetical protein